MLKTRNNILNKVLVFMINLIVSFVLIFIISSQIRANVRVIDLARTTINTSVIQIFDKYGLPNYESYSDFTNREDSFRKLNDFYGKLKKSNVFTFLELHSSMIQIEGNDKRYDKNGYGFIDGYGIIPNEELKQFANQKVNIDGRDIYVSNINNMLIGERTFDYFEFNNKIVSGRAFKSEDFSLNNKKDTINVILGNEYRKIYKIGDKFKAYYLCNLYNYKVVGILEKDTVINFDDNIVSLDYYVIMPSFHINSKTYAKSSKPNFYVKHYLNKTGGFIAVNSKSEVNPVMKKFRDISKEYDLAYDCSPLGASYDNDASILSASTINKDMLLLSIIQIIILCLITNFIFLYNFRKNIKTYSIHLINGASLFIIKIKIYLEIVTLMLSSYLASVVAFYTLNRNIFGKPVMKVSFLILLLIEIISFAITFLVTNYYINKTPIYLSLRRRE